MSGQVPPSSRAGKSRGPLRTALQRARDLYERFTGHDGEVIAEVDLPEPPPSLAVIGELDAVEYTTVRDGVIERYRHTFKARDRGLLCVSPDARQLFIVGGSYVFTERGIVDLSDKKNLPPGLR